MEKQNPRATVYVGNFPYNTTEQELRDLFTPREIRRVTVVMDRSQEPPRPKGFAFVEFANESDAKSAIGALNGTMFGGRTLKVDAANERTRGPSRDQRDGRRERERNGRGSKDDFWNK
jgi:RNA recognition motif-containing protein